jgi:hypothetical protein
VRSSEALVDMVAIGRGDDFAAIGVSMVGLGARGHGAAAVPRFGAGVADGVTRVSSGGAMIGKGTVDQHRQRVLAEGFAQKADGTGLSHALFRGGVDIGRDEDDGAALAPCMQLPLQLRPAHAGHDDVQQETASPCQVGALQKRLAGGESMRFVTHGAQQIAQAAAHGIIIVHDGHQAGFPRTVQ